MTISVPFLRGTILSGIIAASSWLVMQQLGLLQEICNRECDAIRGTILATVLPTVSLLTAGAIFVALIRRMNVVPVQRATAFAAVALMAYSLTQGAFCRPCFAVNALWLALAATELKPRVALITSGIAIVSVVAILLTLENLPSEGRAPKVALLTLRGQETKLGSPHLMVLFLDPACPHCRAAFATYYSKRDRLLVRWLIMSSHFSTVKDIAILVESRFANDRHSGWEILKKWYESPASVGPTPAGVSAFLATEQEASNPDQQLAVIAQDGTLAEQLDLEGVPGFGAVLRVSPAKTAVERVSKKAFTYFLSQQ